MFTKILDGISSTRRVHQPTYMTPTAPYIVGQLPASAMNSTAVDSVAQQQREPCWTILVLFPDDRCEPIPGRPSDTIASLRTTRLDNLWETHCDRSHYNHRAPYCYRVIMTTTRTKSGDELLALRDEDTLYKCGLRDGSKLRLVAGDGPRPARSSSTVSENSNNCGDGPSTPSPKTRNSSRYRDDGGSGKRIVDYAISTQKACIISPNAGVMASWSPSTYGHRPPSPAGGGYGFEHQQHEEPEMLDLRHHHNVFGGGAMDDEPSRLTGSLVSRKAQQPHQRLGLSPQEANTGCALPKLETVSLATGPSPDCFLDYWVMSSRHSQYSRGAVSACTGLSLQAAATILTSASEGQTRPHRPFGCSLELLERILEEGSTYRGSAHEDLPSVLKRRQDLVEQGLQHINGSAASGGMVDVDPQQPYRGLVLGQRMAQDRGQLIAGVFTCQAQSIAMFFLPSSPDVFLFDSHSRADGSGPPAGAAFRFFSCLRDMCAYISILFRLEVDEPLDDMEANQLAIMSVGQVDFLSLGPPSSAAGRHRIASKASVIAPRPNGRRSTGGLHGLPTWSVEEIGDIDSSDEDSERYKPQQHPSRGRSGYDSNPAVTPGRHAHDKKSTSSSRASSRPPSRPSSPPHERVATADVGNTGDLLRINHDLHQHCIVLQKELQREKDKCHGLEKTVLRLEYAESQNRPLREELKAEKKLCARLERQLAELRTRPAVPVPPPSHQKHRPGRRARQKPSDKGLEEGIKSAAELNTQVSNLQGQLAHLQKMHDMVRKEKHALQVERDQLRNSSAPAVVSDEEFARRLQAEEEIALVERQRDHEFAIRTHMVEADNARISLVSAQEIQHEIYTRDEFVANDLSAAQRLDDELKRQQFECPVCMDQKHNEDIFIVEGCDHSMCRECASTYVEGQLEARHVPITCMAHGCEQPIADWVLESVMDGDQIYAWRVLSRRPITDPNFRQCPTPDCNGFHLVDGPEDGDCRCAACNHRWCSLCDVDLVDSQHVDISCAEYQRWREDNAEGDNRMEQLMDEENYRKCPACGAITSKIEGCNHMTCGACQAHWCWCCAQFYADNGHAVYNHQGSCSRDMEK